MFLFNGSMKTNDDHTENVFTALYSYSKNDLVAKGFIDPVWRGCSP
jgi:hypothetical protein